MTFKENLGRFIQAIQEDTNFDLEELQELIIDTSEDEIRLSSKLFIQLCRLLTEVLIRTKRSVSGINLMSLAILKFQHHRGQLTPLHADFCLLCLDSKCLNPALKFLEIDYTEIRKAQDESDENEFNHVLLFYYYGGLIYAAVKDYERALFYFEIALTMPATHVNYAMQEAYKKYIILTLLINGKLTEGFLPKYTSQCLLRQRKQVGSIYLKLALEYVSLNYEKIQRFVSTNTAAYERDENMGLIKQCLTQVHKRNIQRLTKTFLTLPLRDVANYVGLASEKEAELHILNMIDDGEISATINQKDGMVIFKEDTEKFDSVAVFQKLQDDISVTINLIDTLKKMDAESVAESKSSLCKMNSDVQ